MKAPGASNGRRGLDALSELARDSVRPPTSARLDSGLDALRSRIDAEESVQARAPRVWRSAARFALAGVMAAAIGGGLVLRSARPRAPGAAAPALAYRVEGGSVVDGGYLRESGRAGIKLFFAEGTEFILTPGTRSRLRAVDATGARIAIEHGTASFQVTPSPDHRWQVDVGPFLVTVKGTVFTVSWDAASERFELTLRHGRVTVSGPVSDATPGGEIALRAGQRLVVDLPRGETVIKDETAETGTETAETAETPAPIDKPGPEPAPPAPPAPAARLDGDRRWAKALAAGHLDRILNEAERAGLKATLDRAASDDLLALADAARYRRRMDLARDALLAERRRFADSPHARDAAFLLGRVEEASDRGLPRALGWYDEYLARAPTGTYASEALGRKMTLTSKLEGPARARPIAEEYLRRFPDGTYAGPARAFLRAP
jgi:hypothetical protein